MIAVMFNASKLRELMTDNRPHTEILTVPEACLHRDAAAMAAGPDVIR